MIITIILVLAGFLSLVALLFIAEGHAQPAVNLATLRKQLHAVDLQAFRNLVDCRDDVFLRGALDGPQFRAIQHARLLAALEYLGCASRNAAMLQRFGEIARHNPDPAVSAAGQKLANSAIRFRLNSLHCVLRLYLALAIPWITVGYSPIAEGYESMTTLVVLLGCLQFEKRGAQIGAPSRLAA